MFSLKTSMLKNIDVFQTSPNTNFELRNFYIMVCATHITSALTLKSPITWRRKHILSAFNDIVQLLEPVAPISSDECEYGLPDLRSSHRIGKKGNSLRR